MTEKEFDPIEAREIIRFQMSYNKQKIKATWALVVVIVFMYLMEEYFGGSQNVPVLVRMGANVGERVKEGEYYRLLTSVFLHAGLLHVFFNTYVLFALGGFFNRILGEARYLTVFFVSGFAGSLASVFVGKTNVSVGASGAIWGLFGASLALALFKTRLLPEAIRLRLRRVTLINLVINLGISFLPMIDFWAHLGGGLGGFLISLAIIFSPGRAFLDRLVSAAFSAVALVLSLIYAASIAYVLWTFEPWIDQFKASLIEVELKDVPFKLAVPEGLKMTTGPNNNANLAYYVFGEPESDRLVLEIHFFHQLSLSKTANKDWLIAQREQLLTAGDVPAEVKKSVYFVDNADGGLLYYEQPSKKNDMVVHNYVITRDDYAIKLSAVTAGKVAQAKVDEVAKKILRSIEK